MRNTCAHISLSFPSSSLLEEYRELYELQRRRLEQQILLLAQERDIWISAACDLAMKVGAGPLSHLARYKPLLLAVLFQGQISSQRTFLFNVIGY